MLDRQAAVRRGKLLQYATLLSCSLEAIVALTAGVIGNSVALVGFGLDSAIEVTSGAAVLWRLHRDHDPCHRERAEKVALKIVGWCFIALAIYIGSDAGWSLWRHENAARNWPGIVVAIFSVIAMPVLARAKRRVAASLNSASMHADSKQSDLCAWLSAILLLGVGLNLLLGWWWADPVAALVMVPIIAVEGRRALQGKACQCEG